MAMARRIQRLQVAIRLLRLPETVLLRLLIRLHLLLRLLRVLWVLWCLGMSQLARLPGGRWAPPMT